MRVFAGWIGALLLMGSLVSASDVSAQPAAPGPHAVSTDALLPQRAPADRWWARDKAKHVAFSFLWTLSTQYVLVDKAGWSNEKALPASVGVTVTIGLSKEVYDWRYSPARRFSEKDLVANAVGILAAVGIILL